MQNKSFVQFIYTKRVCLWIIDKKIIKVDVLNNWYPSH